MDYVSLEFSRPLEKSRMYDRLKGEQLLVTADVFTKVAKINLVSYIISNLLNFDLQAFDLLIPSTLSQEMFTFSGAKSNVQVWRNDYFPK